MLAYELWDFLISSFETLVHSVFGFINLEACHIYIDFFFHNITQINV